MSASGVIRFRLVPDASEISGVYEDEQGRRRTEMSPAARQGAFLAQLRHDGFAPYDTDAAGFQLWRRAPASAAPSKRKARKACPRCGFVVSSAGV